MLKKTKSLSLAALALALLASSQPAHAILTYYVYESGGNLVVETKGSLNLPQAVNSPGGGCGRNVLIAASAIICTGSLGSSPNYLVSGPTSFSATSSLNGSGTGFGTGLFANTPTGFVIESTYVPGEPIVSSASFPGETLAANGFTTPGLLATWTLLPKDGSDPYTANDTIQLFVGPPPSTSTGVPGPLPLFGAAAAFGYSRRLRRRVSQSRVAPQPASQLSA